VASITVIDGPAATIPQQQLVVKSLRRTGLRIFDGTNRSWGWYLAIILMAWREDVVIHNSWISRCANSPSPGLQRMIERVALAYRVSGVWCIPTMKQLEDPRLKREHTRFVELDTAITMCPWHPKFETEDVLIESINKARSPINTGPGIGSWQPGVTLLVGQQSNTKRDLPFVRMDKKGCSHWLAEQMTGWGVDERELYWIDAYQPDGKATRHDFMQELHPKLVIALGKVASEWLEEIAQPHLRAPHPQRWKRYHHNESYRLRAYLANGATA